MLPSIKAFAAAVLTVTSVAAKGQDVAGRWQGAADLNGMAFLILLDLERDATGTWVGSVTLPGRGVKGAPLRLNVGEGGLTAHLDSAFPGAGIQASAALRLGTDATLTGEFRQGGLTAPLVMRRVGIAQADLPVANATLAPALQGTWRGSYQLGGYPRDVTLTLANGPAGPASGQLRIVGRRTTELLVDQISQSAQYLQLVATEAAFRIEGRWIEADAIIVGEVLQGPFEAAIILRRVSPAAHQAR
jgi:hypothetical protein